MPVDLEDAYCSLEFLQRDTGNSDAELQDWFHTCINAASRWIDDYCHTDFLPHDYSVTPYEVKQSDISKDYLFLPWPVITLTEISAAGVVLNTSLYEYKVRSRTIRMKDGSSWNTKFEPMSPLSGYGVNWEALKMSLTLPILVTGTFGYTTPPSSIQIACCRIAAAWTQEKRRDKLSMDGTRTSLMDDRIPSDALDILKRFKRLVH